MRKLWIGAALVGTLAAACASAADDAALAPEAPAAERGADIAGEEFVGEGELGATEPGVIGQELPAVGARIIKNADLRLEVERGGFKEALQDATAVADTHGGFVVSSRIEGEKARRGSLVIRVPSDAFEQALGDLRELGTVQGEAISGEDVSQEFVDLEARLRNLEAQEAVLLRLMDRAETIADTIKVQQELTGIQLEVEQIKGRLAFLEDRTSFGTIAIRMREAGVVAAKEPGQVERAWERALDGLVAVLSGLMTVVVFIVPLGALALGIWLVLRRVVPGFAAKRP